MANFDLMRRLVTATGGGSEMRLLVMCRLGGPRREQGGA